MIVSPLRYPGGKAKLFPFFSELIKLNGLFGSEYCEPYAGGAGLAIRLLTMGYVDSISINDLDQSIYSFWCAALHDTEKFCRLIEKTPVNIDQWYRQREIWEDGDADNMLALGFSAFFLNRTNRSGIIEGAGPIGGYEQNGDWKLGVRLVKDKQIENLKALSRYVRQIKVTNLDALGFVKKKIKRKNTLVYLDPPYYVKGHKLYKNFYKPEDHLRIAREMKSHRKAKWVVSYDDVPEIRKAYSGFDPVSYLLNYSAGQKTTGREVIFLSDVLEFPDVRGFAMAA
ncbi:MAG: adenine methylase [Hyphomicrobiales bacterium]|jgi:DNA adenine methylase|nr:adenine methylase [Hyphomicrobiales bacterium]